MRIARRVMAAFVPALLLAIGLTDASTAQDPPDRVGRLSYLAGDVSFRPAGVDDWDAATLNYPLTTGDDIWADAGARAEIALGSAAIRLAPSTAFGVLALDDQMTQVRLTQGSVFVRIRELADDETFEIDTPNGAVSLLAPGSYRVDVDENGDATTATVRAGRAELTAAGSSFSVDPGQAATVSGTDSPSYDVHDPHPPDAWENWGVARDRRRDVSSSARYVSPDMPGYEDLDDNGDWRETPEYGPVWTPRHVAAGWAPYRDGHWAWVDRWGWTWIDDAPWGFAPYHYGRWAYVGDGWGWVPGHVVARPVYAPALVVFVGGSNWSISVGVGGGVGWFPLGPNEAYVPTYRVSDRYVHNINITTINVTTISLGDMTSFNYRNRGSPGGVTVVARETFVGARPVGRGVIVVPQDRLNSAPIVGTAAPFAPTRESVLQQSGGAARRPPPANETRRVVVRTAPPPAPVPFAVREPALQAHPGRPLDQATVATLRGRTPTTENRPVRPATGGGGAALRPARGGLPAARPASPAGGRRPGQVERPAVPPRVAPQPEPRPPVAPRPAERAPAPVLPTPPRLPAEQPQPAQPPAPPPPQDRRQRPGAGRPQAEPRPPVAQPTPEQPKAAQPPAPPPPQDRRQRPGAGRPQAEPRPPVAQPTPEQPKAAQPPAPPQQQDRGRRQPQPEPRRAAPPAAPAPPPPPRAAPVEPAAPAQQAAPPQRQRPSKPERGGQDSSGKNQRPSRPGQDSSGHNPR